MRDVKRLFPAALAIAIVSMIGALASAENDSAAAPAAKAAAKSAKTAAKSTKAAAKSKVIKRERTKFGTRVHYADGSQAFVKKKKRGRYTGTSVPGSHLRVAPLNKPSGNIWIYAENFREEVRVNIYKKDGSLNHAALAKLDHGFRCKRTTKERAADPRLYEMLSRIYDHFGGVRIDLISGFRFQRNEGSRHFHASAMDIRVPGVTVRDLYKFADTLDRGGMGIGIYPNGGFVHVDIRAPGDPSYRWTDRSGSSAKKRKRKTPTPRSKRPKS